MKRVKNRLLLELLYIRFIKKEFITGGKTKLSYSIYFGFYSVTTCRSQILQLCFDSDSDLIAVQRVYIHTWIFLYNTKLFSLNRTFRYLPVLLCWNMKLSTDHSYFDYPVRSRYIFFMDKTKKFTRFQKKRLFTRKQN